MFNLILIVIIFSINIIEISSESNNCRFLFENGTGIDLSLLNTPNNYLTATTGNLTYLFHPCENTNRLPTKESNECSTGYSICLQNHTVFDNKTKQDSYKNLGIASQASFKVSNSEAYLIYNRSSKLTIIRLACVNILDTYLLAPKSSDLINDVLILFSPYSCVVQLENHHSLSTGSKLVIIFFAGVFSYLALGIAVKFFIFGARGIETLPNLEFWQDFPNLIRDGGRFVQNGCKVDLLAQNNQETYDAI